MLAIILWTIKRAPALFLSFKNVSLSQIVRDSFTDIESVAFPQAPLSVSCAQEGNTWVC